MYVCALALLTPNHPNNALCTKKINSFIVIVAFSVTLEKLNRNPQAKPPQNFFHTFFFRHPPSHSKTCYAIPEISIPYHGRYLGIPREMGVSWAGIPKARGITQFGIPKAWGGGSATNL